jgi:hypothetical protein
MLEAIMMSPPWREASHKGKKHPHIINKDRIIGINKALMMIRYIGLPK